MPPPRTRPAERLELSRGAASKLGERDGLSPKREPDGAVGVPWHSKAHRPFYNVGFHLFDIEALPP